MVISIKMYLAGIFPFQIVVSEASKSWKEDGYLQG